MGLESLPMAIDSFIGGRSTFNKEIDFDCSRKEDVEEEVNPWIALDSGEEGELELEEELGEEEEDKVKVIVSGT